MYKNMTNKLSSTLKYMCYMQTLYIFPKKGGVKHVKQQRFLFLTHYWDSTNKSMTRNI